MTISDAIQAGTVTVEIINPVAPFGGVIVEGANDVSPIQIALDSGSPVRSVFGRVGNITQLPTDYASFYAPLAAGLPTGGKPGQVLSKKSSEDFDAGWVSISISGGVVTSVFTRVGDVVAQTGDYSLDQIGPPVANWALSGFRVKADGSFQLWNPDQSAWHTLHVRGLAGGEYITIGAADTTALARTNGSSPTPIDSGAVPSSTAVTSVFTRVGDVVAQTGDYTLDQIGAPTANWTLAGMRVTAAGAFQLWNPDQSLWHTLQVRGVAGGEYITIGAGQP